MTPNWYAFVRVMGRADQSASVRFHELRHTCATLALSSNVDPKVVSEMLGYSTVAVTLDIYSHVTPDMQEDAKVGPPSGCLRLHPMERMKEEVINKRAV